MFKFIYLKTRSYTLNNRETLLKMKQAEFSFEKKRAREWQSLYAEEFRWLRSFPLAPVLYERTFSDEEPP